MTLNELISKLEKLRAETPGNGDLPVYANDWGECYRSPTPIPEPMIEVEPFTAEHFDGKAIVKTEVSKAVFVI